MYFHNLKRQFGDGNVYMTNSYDISSQFYKNFEEENIMCFDFLHTQASNTGS